MERNQSFTLYFANDQLWLGAQIIAGAEKGKMVSGNQNGTLILITLFIGSVKSTADNYLPRHDDDENMSI